MGVRLQLLICAFTILLSSIQCRPQDEEVVVVEGVAGVEDGPCYGVFDCLSGGKCSSSEPCECNAGGECVQPEWLKQSPDPTKLNCRNVKDCSDAIHDCQDHECKCETEEGSEWGRCQVIPCQFTPDCKRLQRCVNIADASCVCNLGSCVITGGYWFRSPDYKPECLTYQDCACKGNKSNCFCRNDFCRTEAWECHESSDCKSLEKCKDKDCTCSGNTCEFECDADVDCANYQCNKDVGYKCKCEDSLCVHESLPQECENIEECVEIGKCQSDQPCDCRNGFCTKPWWIFQDKPHLDCRTSQDCIDSILDCQNGLNDCPCREIERLSEYEAQGRCSIEPFPPQAQEPPCTFTTDCDQRHSCRSLADAGCACNFGHCNISGGFFFRSKDFKPECETYEDCKCRDNPGECFCKSELCVEAAWECHTSAECTGLEKCKGRSCVCSGNTCEWECNTIEDCQGKQCSQTEGFQCKCEESMCRFEEITKKETTDKPLIFS